LKNIGINIWKDDEGGITGNILEDMEYGGKRTLIYPLNPDQGCPGSGVFWDP